jgi:PAS domain S-box-containing protein
MPGIRRTLLLNVTAVAAYLVAARLGYLCAFPDQQAAVVWPPAGVALAVVVLWGWRALPSVAAGSLIAQTIVGAPLAFSLLATSGDVFQCALAVWLLRQAAFHHDLARTRDVVSLVGLGMGLAMMAGATVGAGALWLFDLADGAPFTSLWWRWWLANGMGVLLATPLVLAWAPGTSDSRPRARRLERHLTLAAVVIVSSLVFLGLVGRHMQFSLLFTTFPLLLWMGLRHPLRPTTLAIVVTAAISIAGTVTSRSVFSSPELSIRLVILWGYTGTITIMTLLLSAAVNETERADETLRERDAQLRLIFDAAPVGIVLVDPAGHVIRSNPAFQRMIGYSDEELRAQPLADAGEPANVSPGRDVIAAFDNDRSTHLQLEKQYRHRDGSPVWARVFGSAVRDEQGRFLHTVSLVEDVTERRRLEAELLQAQKMESIGRLAGGVAHDFNNLLTAILGYVDLADASASDEAHVRECLAPIRSSAERAGQLTRQLLAFARKQIIEPTIVDLRVVVANVQELLRRLLGEDIDLVMVGALDLWLVRADVGQFEQVILNLAVNGRDAMPLGGRLTIEVRNAEIDEAWARAHSEIVPGPYVVLSVTDEGTGMTEEVQKRVFDPFFTTKALGAGTGLGLSMVHGTVKQHGGYIEIDSAPDRGTTLSIYLPRVRETAAEAARPLPSAASDLPRGDETVLLVEDEFLVREMATAALRNVGYQVLAASSGDTALAAAADHGGAIDLLLTDVIMPRMSGTELADRLLAARPGLRVLYTSGYTQDLLATRGLNGISVSFLAKPYSPSTLARQVRHVLDG